MKTIKHFLLKQVHVENEWYDFFADQLQARGLFKQVLCIVGYLLPGILAYLLINIKPVHDFVSTRQGFEGYNYQYFLFIFFTIGWHIILPVVMLRKSDKLSWKAVAEALSLNRFSFKEILLAGPLAFVVSVIFSLPYMMYLYEPFQNWLNSIGILQIPGYSIFASYEAFYGASTLVMLLMLVGNFIGEEIYFRGYLMKKSAFFGKYNWLFNSLLFCIYHLWQIPQSLPLVVPFLFFGLVMQWRKNLYALFVFHLLFNLGGVQIYNVLLGLGS